MRMNAVIGSVALALTATILTACGGGGGGGGSSNASGTYCAELKVDKSYFEALSGSSTPDISKLGVVFQRIDTLAADAPANVAPDWKTLDTAITSIETALKSAGLTFGDLAAMQNGSPPAGVDLAKLQALAPKLEALSNSDVSTAADAISADAKKSCGVDLTK
jgi:hypothetical protein